MKVFIITLMSFFIQVLLFAQNKIGIVSKISKPKAGIENSFVYYPPAHLAIPDSIYASVIYETNSGMHNKLIPIKIIDKKYEFSFKENDSVNTFIATITDANNKQLDNNSDQGFSIYLYGKNGVVPGAAYISAANLLSFPALRYFNLNRDKLQLQIMSLYEKGYKISPSLNRDAYYVYYLNLLYQQKKDTVKPKLIAIAKRMSMAKDDELQWMNAIKIYQLLQMSKEAALIVKKAISTYPKGGIAKNNFWEIFDSTPDKTEQFILASMNEFVQQFKSVSTEENSRFYTVMVGTLIEKKQWDKLPKYERLYEDKIALASMYNYFAWKLSGEEIDNAGTDLQIAKMLSQKAVGFIENELKIAVTKNELNQSLQGTYNTNSDTYALILYKLGQYDSAFFYQDVIYKQGGQLDAGGLERYAVYAEKIKGAEYTKPIIEQELLKGVNSPAMAKQLQSIYNKLHLPESEFSKLREKSHLAARQKSMDAIKLKFGVVKANNFSLKNTEGKTVTLSSLANKVVIIDFWATWCVPCRASFPAMQEIVSKYRDDSSVAFLFIDTWENKPENEMVKAAIAFIKTNQYSFNVLIDTHNKAILDYKVEGIPAKFIIDKKGDIIYMGLETKDLPAIIEEEKNKVI